MSNAEKIILSVTVALSWVFGFLVVYVFGNVTNPWSAFWLVCGGLMVWLIPFIFSVLFIKKAVWPIVACALGLLSFLTVRGNIYVILGLFLIVIGFINWFFQVRFARKMSVGFSVRHSMKGIRLFIVFISIFGGFLSFYSPYARQVTALKLKVPEKVFDSVYDPLSEVILNQVNSQFNNSILNPGFSDNPQLLEKIPGAGAINDRLSGGAVPDSVLKEISGALPRAPTAEELKPQFYQSINGSINELANKYQNYIPFAFAASVFFLLQTIFIPIKYLSLLAVFLLIKMFIKLGWFKKEKIQVEVEVISI